MGTLILGDVSTPGTLMGEVKAGLGNRGDTDGRILTALNLSQERLARLYDFAEMNITKTSAITYTGIPATDLMMPMPDSAPYIREIFSVVLKDGAMSHKLKQIPTRTWDQRLGDPTAIGGNDRPYIYTIWDYNLAQAEIFPLPTKSFTVQWRISQWPTPLLASTPNQKSIFRFKDELIIEGAIIYLMFSLGKEEDALKHVKKLGTFLGEAIKAEPRSPDIDVGPSPATEGYGPIGAYWLNPFVNGLEDVYRP